ncbi:hypothetical protein FOVG_19741 [Fusarium oxysporum f. sp. pisi HDV247]|uniref:Uncharacterized protein n=1 Tax=Fusarium oxysporum f. sp. pisi HDV247 TaxID=1080344 RepID=W9N7F1_FUSOX|nr:hypothetical protein FOVG_19741 [Fusarium oxysporum f. sp. pisi HDV247]
MAFLYLAARSSVSVLLERSTAEVHSSFLMTVSRLWTLTLVLAFSTWSSIRHAAIMKAPLFWLHTRFRSLDRLIILSTWKRVASLSRAHLSSCPARTEPFRSSQDPHLWSWTRTQILKQQVVVIQRRLCLMNPARRVHRQIQPSLIPRTNRQSRLAAKR